MSAPMPPSESSSADLTHTDNGPIAPAETVATASAETVPAAPAETVPVAPAETATVSVQAIANAYVDYTRKSFEQTKFFLEMLAGARSLDKALELQTDFAKQAYETFIADSQKICELQNELAKLRLERLERFMAALMPRMTRS